MTNGEMNVADLPEGFYVGDLYCFPIGSPEGGNFGYIPGPPAVEAEEGNVKASLLASPVAAILSLQAVWQAEQAAVDAAEEAIRERYPNAGSINLQVAELTDTTASLTVTGANGMTHTFGPNETSGPDSYRVVFSGTLNSAEKLAAISAFHGQPGVLTLTYSGMLALRETTTVELSGDLADEVKALAPKKEEKKSIRFFVKKKDPEPPPPPPDLAACAAAVQKALSSGRLQMIRTDTPNVSDALRSKVETGLLNNVAARLLDKLVQMGEDAIYLSSFAIRQKASDGEQVRFQVSRVADPAGWFAQHGGGRLVTEAGAVIAEPER